ncbi:acetyl-CoA sensor PanZ family protein [Pseudomonas borbori]
MPVVVEFASPARAQDRIDLGKIYQDAPTWLLPPYADAQQLIDAALAANTLLVGRFNDRLLGAAVLERQADRWLLTHLCVRSITRQRGVGRRLLDEAQRLAGEAGKPLQLWIPAGHPQRQALVARYGSQVAE